MWLSPLVRRNTAANLYIEEVDVAFGSHSIMLPSSPLLCFLLCAAANGAAVAGPQVDLTSGNFVGVTSAANGTDKWLGIPFAQPPTGNLRFKAPVAITKPSRGVLQATQFGNACPQLPSSSLGAPQSEDCLFLNVSTKETICTPTLHISTGVATHRNNNHR